MFPEGAPRERRSRIASVRRSAARAPRAAALLRPGPYRSGWLVVLVPAFVLLVGARTAPALPRSSLPPTFDGAQALAATNELAERFGDRSPGSAGDRSAANWVAARLRASGADVSIQHFRAPDANGRTVPMLNVLGVVSGHGRSRNALVFIAGRDDRPPGPGANDNGSGTGALVELARTLVGSVTQTSLVFASVDGTTAESAGARALARHPPAGLRLSAGIALRAVGRPATPLVLRLSGEGHRLPAAGWLRTVEQALRDEDVQEVRLPSLGQQVAALVAPVVHGDQARPGRRRRRRRRHRRLTPRDSAPRPTPPRSRCSETCSRSPQTCWGASAPRRSSPRWPSTPGRSRPASARPTSSRAIACCADGRSSSFSSRC